MPINVIARGGSGHMQNIRNLNANQATDILKRVKAHVDLPNKSSGVFVLVNRSKDGADMELRRKSGWQLWGRGTDNTRLNQTREFWDTVLRRAGRPDAADRLTDHLNNKPKGGHANRVDVAFIKNLLKDYNVEVPGADKGAAVDTDESMRQGKIARPPLAEGKTLAEVRKKAGMRVGKELGAGSFGTVNLLTMGKDKTNRVLKTFKGGKTPTLYADRKAKVNEATAAYLVSKKESGYAQKAGVAETQYFTVAVGGKFQMVDSLGLRALLKSHPEGSVELHEIVMEKADGQTAFGHVAADKLNPEQRKGLTRQMLTSLKELNRRGFVVRDHKWENVMYDPATNKAKLIDTGMFHKVSKTRPDTRFINGSFGGTKVYMHARALSRAPHGSETDVYAQAIMTLALEHPGAMGLMIKKYIEPRANHCMTLGKQGTRVTKGIGSADFRDMVESAMKGFPNDQVPRALRDLYNGIQDPNSPSNLAMKCLDKANVSAAEWADRAKAQSMFDELLAHPSLN